MQIQHEERDGFMVVRPAGDFSLYNVYLVKSVFKDLLHQGHQRFGIDLSHTTTLDSAGIGTLLSLHKETCSFPGGFLFLFGASKAIRQAFETAQVDKLIRVFETFEDGLEAISES